MERIISVSPLQMQKETLRLFKQFAGYLLFVFTFLLTAVTAYGQGVQFIAAESASGNSGNPSVNINGGRSSGDLLMAFVSAKNASTMSDPPTGWLALGTGVFSGGNNSTYVFYKFSDGTETNFTITLSSYNPNDQVTQFFYRLKYITTGDSAAYSPVRAVRFSEVNDIDMNTWPNPATDIVNIQLKNVVDESVLVKLLDRQGAEISSKWFSPNEIIRFEVAGIAPGVYLIDVITQKGKRTEKVVVWR